MNFRHSPGPATVAIAAALATLLAAAGSYVAASPRSTPIARQLEDLTGTRTRVVWCRQATGGSEDVTAQSTNLVLMGIDSRDPAGERRIVPRTGNFRRPLLTADGNRVVFTDLPANRICCVNWDGTALTDLAAGQAACLWRDPATQVDWVYAIPNREDAGGPLVRFPLDNPAAVETVWTNTPVAVDGARISVDGTHLLAQFPWPDTAFADFATGSRTPLARGCWPSLAPDDSGVVWVFDGAHRNVIMQRPGSDARWTVDISAAKGIDGAEVYHPRWSNRVRFMCLTGPYLVGAGANRIEGGGGKVEVYLGRFNAELTAVEAWVQVTRNEQADFYPDAWIDVGGKAGRGAAPTRGPGGTTARAEPLLIRGRLLECTPVPTLDAIAPYRQALVVYDYEVESVLTGSYDRKRILVAHWAIVAGVTHAPRQRPGDVCELSLAPYETRRELEGERLVMDVHDKRLPLYYDLNSR